MSTILQLLQNHGITPKRVSNSKGGEFHSPCPGCGGEDRFHCWPAQNEGEGSYWCRGCNSGGDCLQFLMDFDGLTFHQAKHELGIEDAECSPSVDRRRAQANKKPTWQPEVKNHSADVVDLPKWLEHAAKFVEKCHAALLDNQTTLAWLAKRGITLAAVQKYRLGLHVTDNGKNSFRPRESWGLTGGINPTTKRPLMFVLPAGVVVPWIIDDQVRRIQIRLAKLDPKYPKKKYHAVVGSAMDTFITSLNAPAYVTVETVLDAIMLDAQVGDLVGAAALISSHAKPTEQATKAMRQADVVLGALDFDQAGSGASAWWPQNFSNFQRHPVPKGGDPGEAYERGVDIRAWIRLGLPQSQTISSIDDVLDFSVCDCVDPADQENSNLVDQSTSEKQPESTSLHPDIRAMAALLQKCPVWIKNTTENLGLRNQVNFNSKKHWELRGQIAELLFDSLPVMNYLAIHPAKAVNAENFLQEVADAA